MSNPERPALPDDIVEQLNRTRGGFNETVGLRFVSAGYDEVVGEIDVGPRHLQPYGLVHGGVYATLIETLASVGAALNEAPRGQHTVGVENATSFLRGVRSGILRGTAVPLTRGRRSHVWEVSLRDDTGRLVATGRVRMLCLPHGSTVAGETVTVVSGRRPWEQSSSP